MGYLYGAAVQGIQSFIFQTNKLVEIVGASELVENICTSFFKRIVGEHYHEYDQEKESGAVMHAAGNVKYIFTNKEDCERVVKLFPRMVLNEAPGITVSQAVVLYNGNFEEAVNELESRLRTQRNVPFRSNTLGLMGIERSRQTGLPVVEVTKEKRYGKETLLYNDQGTLSKRKYNSTSALCNKAFGFNVDGRQVPHDIEDITKSNDWIAIVHIDGNGLGQVVQKVGHNPKGFKYFSEKLDEATTQSANGAFKHILSKFDLENGKNIIPMRPIVLSGDDHTIICRGDMALDYVQAFISEFENHTNEKLGSLLVEHNVFTKGIIRDRLTACAGIAFIKSSYPFYYGYELAESLCTQAKKDAKSNIAQGEELPMSCIMFHKVQDSFVEEWEMIRQRELQPQPDISFEFGPYYLAERKNRWTISQLIEKTHQLHNDDNKEENTLKSHLRNWMSELHSNPQMAEQTLDRLYSIIGKGRMFLLAKEMTGYDLRGDNVKCYPVYDMLAINTINNQVTKNEK